MSNFPYPPPPPPSPEPPKRPWYQKKRFMIPLAVIGLAIIIPTGGDDEPEPVAAEAEEEVEEVEEEDSEAERLAERAQEREERDARLEEERLEREAEREAEEQREAEREEREREREEREAEREREREEREAEQAREAEAIGELSLVIAWESFGPQEQVEICEAYNLLGTELAYESMLEGWYSTGDADLEPPSQEAFGEFYDEKCQ